jgi:large repetitive protein
MTTTSALYRAYILAHRARNLSTSLLAGSFVLAQVTPSLATIDNTANAVGTYGGSTANYGSSTQNVPVAAPVPALTITKAASVPTVANGTDNTIVDASDTITYTYTVKNTGNVTMTGVVPTDPGPTFNSFAGTGSLGAYSPATATLAPGAQQIFTATYTLSQLDADHGAGIASGVSNTAGATGTTPAAVVYNIPPAGKFTATTTIPAGPKLTMAKVAVLTDSNANGKADLGETITYTYTVANTGNVPMTNVTVNDMHGTPAVAVPLGAGGITSETLTVPGPLGAAASADTTANNGIWSTLAPGATVTFTWTHIVTQAEIDHG